MGNSGLVLYVKLNNKINKINYNTLLCLFVLKPTKAKPRRFGSRALPSGYRSPTRARSRARLVGNRGNVPNRQTYSYTLNSILNLMLCYFVLF